MWDVHIRSGRRFQQLDYRCTHHDAAVLGESLIVVVTEVARLVLVHVLKSVVFTHIKCVFKGPLSLSIKLGDFFFESFLLFLFTLKHCFWLLGGCSGFFFVLLFKEACEGTLSIDVLNTDDTKNA